MSEDAEEAPQQGEARDAEQQEANAARNLSAGPDRTVSIDSSAVSLIAAQSSTKKTELEAARRRQLQEIQIKPEDVAVLMSEFEISKAAAELSLRERGGNLRAALDSLLR